MESYLNLSCYFPYFQWFSTTFTYWLILGSYYRNIDKSAFCLLLLFIFYFLEIRVFFVFNHLQKIIFMFRILICLSTIFYNFKTIRWWERIRMCVKYSWKLGLLLKSAWEILTLDTITSDLQPLLLLSPLVC